MKKKIRLDNKQALTATPFDSDTNNTLPLTCRSKATNSQQPPCPINTQLPAQQSRNTEGPSQETLQLSLLFLMSKFALTQEKPYAEAAYQHLHMLAVRCDTDSKPRFLYRSLAMDWVQMCRGQMTTDEKSKTGPH